ncbi:molybdopterin-dependent oxidoreductase, partial [Mesorhizobium sp. M7A.F.Ca.MR.362.00.0.0]
TDMHPFVHPFNKAVDPVWESKSDWNIFKGLAKSFTEMAQSQFDAPEIDVVSVPLNHDAPSEIAQPYGLVKDWKKGEIDAIPGKTMPNFTLVERDY